MSGLPIHYAPDPMSQAPFPYSGYPPNPYLVYPHSPAPAHPASSSYHHDPYYAIPGPVQLAPAPPNKTKPNRSKPAADKTTSYTVCGNRVCDNIGDNNRISDIGVKYGRRDLNKRRIREE
ncbi:hypothetical protein M0R45_021112 [Rubus argutus]|uniref:Uncharacterized protein n=1 Tax=Rubus argutus TaxID=59490 RepID=A0AAW1XDH8_RUBAR